MSTAQNRRNLIIELQSIDAGGFVPPVKISNHEFVISAASETLIKYDINSKEWQEILDYSQHGYELDADYHTLSYDKQQNKYYIYSGSQLIIIDTETKQIERYENKLTDSGINPNSVCINGQFHLLGGHYNNKHLIFDYNATKMFKDNHTFNETVDGISGPGLVYVESKQMIYLMGGYDRGAQHRRLDKIWRYCLNTEKWENLEVKLPKTACDFPTCLTNNERYIVVFVRQEIYYLDLETIPLKFTKSPLEFSKKWANHAIMMGNGLKDELTVSGFVRYLYTSFPDDIIKLITNWYQWKYVHIFERDDYPKWNHSMVNITDIIPSYNKN